MELHVWIADHEAASIRADRGEYDEEQFLREVAGAVERFTKERYGVSFTVEVAE